MKPGSIEKPSRRPLLWVAALLLAAAAWATLPSAWAKSGIGDGTQLKRYVIELQDPPLAAYDGGELFAAAGRSALKLAPTSRDATGERRLDVSTPASVAYLAHLDTRQAELVAQLEALLGRPVEVPHRYRVATNGMAVHLTATEAARVAALPVVKSVEADRVYRLQTYAGPPWLGADEVWGGRAGYPPARGEGIVVGVIDTGINWDHPSFSDQPADGYVFTNPYGSGIGLCSQPDVPCNNKLVGVWDFVKDDPATTEYKEENTKGKDNNGHGSHTAGIAVGVALTRTFSGIARTLSGVAPRANLVSYRVCYMGEPQTDDSEGCQGSAILSAIDQAIIDGVDVINYSIGGDPREPWQTGSADRAFLSARGAGIFVATSAGNGGPNSGTVTSPALAPWLVAVGNATHNRISSSAVQNMTGGALPPSAEIYGASLYGGTGQLNVVHARDYGYPLCGVGEPELQPSCGTNTGASNPWAGQKPFNGEIVVCDRGTYGRVEKSKNLQLAGAGGYILANTAEWGESIVADSHCLPGTHVGRDDGDVLREWLASGTGHSARLSSLILAEIDAIGDQLSQSSSRGPAGEALASLKDVLKPNLIAPGTGILAAFYTGDQFAYLSGTSMASPHVAGAAALLKSVHRDWMANELASALETTATQALAKDQNGDPATTEQVGAGRPQLDQAVNAGLYLDVTQNQFLLANPAFLQGDPGSLNLPGLVDAECKATCAFQRRVTDLMGGGSWTATPVGFPAGTTVTVTPAAFELTNGSSQDLDIQLDVSGSGIIGDWVSGRIRLSAAGSADQYLTVSVKSYGGALPGQLLITSDRDGGWKEFLLDDLVELPNATFTAGGLVKPDSRTETLIEDPTNDDAYDGGPGVFTSWYNLDNGALWLYAHTPASSAPDIDLFVGRDENGNGQAEEWEELCSSTSPQNVESCELENLPPGDYWVLVQNWTASGPAGDAVTLISAAVESGAGSGLAASGPGIVAAGEPFTLRVSWDNLPALPGETWYGAVGIGSNRDSPNNLGVIPVRFERSGVAAARTLALMNGRSHGLALGPGGMHDRAFIDIPPGINRLEVGAAGATAAQSNGLQIDLVRLGLDAGLSDLPFAKPANGNTVVATASGGGGLGPTVAVSGGVEPGRWHAIVRNNGAQAAAVTLSVETVADGSPLDVHPGLWYPAPPRDGINQGYELNWGDGDDPVHSLLWYTYDEDGQPAWFISDGASRNGSNVWTADLLRVTNDGSTQQLAPVGTVQVSMLARDDAVFSYTLFGESGSERMQILSLSTCPQGASYTGLWFRGQDGLGGASVLVNAFTQAQIHYLFDAAGMPRWLIASEDVGPNAPTIEILQFRGFCAVCDPAPGTSSQVVGLLGSSFDSELTGSWTLDFLFRPPLVGSVQRTDSTVKLTHRIDCR